MSRLGSISALTSTIVAAGRISPNTSPWTADDLGRTRDVGDEHPGPHDVGQTRTRPRPGRRSMISRTARACAADVARDGATGRRARRRSCRRPSTNRRRRSPGCSRRRPPTARPTRSAGARSCRLVGPPPGEDLGVARRWPAAGRPAASSGARSSRPRGTPPGRGRCRRSVPGRRGWGRPARRSCWRPTRRRSRRRRPRSPSARAMRLGVLDQAAAALELLHRPPARHRLEVDGHVGDLGRLGDRADRRLGRLERLARRRPDVDLERARLGDDVGPRPADDDARR